MKKSAFLFLISFLIVALGQPDTSLALSVLASCVGFALFWKALFDFPQRKRRFLLATCWFIAVQSVQLAWLATPEYQGFYIYFVYAAFTIYLGVQFGLFSLLLPKKAPISLSQIFFLAAIWTLLEWGRLFLLCGFVWNPVGLSMTAFPVASQLASVWGIFGLSFWTILVNLLVLNFYYTRHKVKGYLAAGFLLFPYCFGLLHIAYHDTKKTNHEMPYNVALVQTGLKPDEKSYFYQKREAFISPYRQWEAILTYLRKHESKKLDLIVLPEYAVPFTAQAPVYAYEEVKKVFESVWGKGDHAEHLLIPTLSEHREKWYVSNLFWAKALADHYGSEVVLGLDESDLAANKSYNAAFHILPHKNSINRYEKRVLLPLAEYLPFSFLRPLVARYGVSDFFTHGTEAKVFEGACPLNISICYEECFSHLMREGKINGAKLFVNVTNDGWYPSSRLPFKHFRHGKMRAIENGVPLVRACNTGVTAAIDSLGRTIGRFETNPQWQKGALVISVDLYSFPTLYTRFGDYLIIAICCLCILVSLIQHLRMRRESS